MRDQKLETLRGLALFCVLGHHANSKSWIGEYVSINVGFVMMPLFAAISGYIMGIRPIEMGQLSGFACGKLARIGLPMVCLMSFMLLMLFAFPTVFTLIYTEGPPRSVGGVVHFFIVHPQTFWFLQAILVLYLVVGFADSRGVFARVHIWLLALAGSALLLIAPWRMTGYLSLDGAQLLAPYFLQGFGLGRFKLLNLGAQFRAPILISGLLFLLLVQVDYFWGRLIDYDERSLFGLCGSLLLTSALFFWRGAIAWLSKLGGHSFGIYLFHRLGWVLGMLIIPFSPKMFGADLVLHVIVMLVVGLFATMLFRSTSMTRIMFLGEKSNITK